jgi:outer membrane protein TolC
MLESITAVRFFPVLGAAILLASARAGAQTPKADPLASLIREAIRSNLALAQQRVGERAADAAVREARALALPTLSLETRRSEINGGLNLGDLVNPAYRMLNQLSGSSAFPTNLDVTLPFAQESRLRFTQAIYQPAIGAGVSAAANLRDAESAELRAAARRLAADVQTSYWSVASAERVAELYRATLPLVDENVRVNERLLANGKVTADAVLRARAERSEIVQQLAEANQRRAAAARAFNHLLNRPVETQVESLPDSAMDATIDLPLEELIRHARTGREELKQAEYGIRATDAKERAATAAFLPGLVLAVDYGFQGDTYRFDRDHDALVASLALQWNVFNGGRDVARREQALLDGRRLRLARQDLERRIELDVRQAYDAALVARDAIATAQDRLAAAKRSFELVSRRYDEGMASHIEFIDARVAYTRAGLNLIVTRQSYATRCADLERAAALRTLEF